MTNEIHGPNSPHFRNSPILREESPEKAPLPKGNATFEAEGSSIPGRYYSRVMHWPGGASGVTIGRGYDLGKRSAMEIIADLTRAGVPRPDVALLAGAAGKTGVVARNFVAAMRNQTLELSEEAEKRLFYDILFPRYEADTRRIFDSDAVQMTYGERRWKSLPRKVQELFIDLRFRGDYTPKTRPYIQRVVANGDLAGLLEVMKNKELWKSFGVPPDRQERRIKLLEGSRR